MEERIPKQYEGLAEKISLLLPATESLKEYESRMIQKAFEIFGTILNRKDPHLSTKAQFSYRLPDSAPSIMPLYLLSPSNPKCYMRAFFEEMTKHWLNEKQPIRILSSQEVHFSNHYFLELLIYVQDTLQLTIIKNNLERFSNEIRQGALSYLSSHHILRLKHLPIEEKNTLVYTHAKLLSERFPKSFAIDFFKTLENFLLNIRPAFQEKRSVRHLCRIIYTFYLFQKSLIQSTKVFPSRRHVHTKFFPSKVHYPFGLKEVLSIVVSINSLSEYEKFTHKHILHALRRLLPFIECNKDSFYCHRDEQLPLLTFYMEVEKREGTKFTLDELKVLTKQLPHELKNSIEHLSPSLFIPRNEEELMRNIIALSHELKYVRDLPQAIISFQEQKGNFLRFNVVLLRLLTKTTLSMQALAHHLPSSMRFLFERVSHVGHARKKYIKEANVFTLEVKNSLFFRENHSVDLVRARQFITKAIEKMVGKFRDYNGGLLLKQNQRLEAIKKLLPDYRKQYEYLFENLFYSLSPPMMQASLPLEEGTSMFSLFLEALSMPLTTQKSILLIHKQMNTSLAIIVKTSDMQCKEQISRSLLRLSFGSLKFTKGSIDIEDHSYLSYLLLDNCPEKQNELLDLIKEEIEKWREKQRRMQILRLHLPRATPTLDPRLETERTSGALIKMLYEGLMRVDAHNNLQPAIAENVTLSEDQTSYTFSLKKSFWSNQEPLTAYDFEYAWKSIIDPAFSSPYSFLFFAIKNAEKAKRGLLSLDHVGIYPLDDYHLRVDLEHPAPHFLQLTTTSFFSPLWHKIDKKYPGWAHYSEKQYICNGPFKLDLWKMNNDLTMIKNSLYWNAPAIQLDKIFINIIENEKMALEMFKRGELDWLGDPLSKVPISEIDSLAKKRELLQDDTQTLFFLHLNIQSAPFHSQKIRKACYHAICRRSILDQLPLCGDKPAQRFFLGTEPPSHLFSDENQCLALQLFEEGLEEAGLTRKDISPIRISHSDLEEQQLLSQAVGKMWEDLFNIEVIYERVAWNEYYNKIMEGDYMVCGVTWYRRYEDPSYIFDFYSQNSNELKLTTWKNKRYLQQVDGAKRSLNQKEKDAYLCEAEKILLEEMPLIPVLEQKFRYLKNKRLKNVNLSNLTMIDFSAAYLSQTDEEEEL